MIRLALLLVLALVVGCADDPAAPPVVSVDSAPSLYLNSGTTTYDFEDIAGESGTVGVSIWISEDPISVHCGGQTDGFPTTQINTPAVLREFTATILDPGAEIPTYELAFMADFPDINGFIDQHGRLIPGEEELTPAGNPKVEYRYEGPITLSLYGQDAHCQASEYCDDGPGGTIYSGFRAYFEATPTPTP